ncbi:hypothetical protein PHAVU_011G202000 [Phaseolus vulgaris]|uniref:Beta-glucosidase n=1 Tax=Phaseolus vulgaris TaxID=3885 RepID=V7AND2_PHAVU|nr:hypothetical protein PHAVU_011G202000g [Phaseolus vulgaris]ESW05701.1 hypothetical protein PHAVU_011G202000g [Phaseolus vulgaris]
MKIVAMVLSWNLLSGVLLLMLSVPICIEGSVSIFSTDDFRSTSLNRSSFPKGFIFGAGSSSYQCEGAANVGGRGPSIWDTFTHTHPDKILDGSNGDVSIDQYHRYKEDVENIKEMNMDAFRFSISWSRILPKGKVSGGVNKEGINYYNNLINELLDKGLKPFATLFHWDLPQALEDEYDGFLSPNIVDDFKDYAELCFKEFGDRVKHWTTLNEPWTFSTYGYAEAAFPPGRCSTWQNLSCTAGDSATEPYIVTHNQLLAHAAAVNVYKTKYQVSQKGVIGISLACHWIVPLYDTELDQFAAERALDFLIGWFMEPMTIGEYPKSMQSLVGSRLPKFSADEIKLVRGSFDFIGINYYTSYYASDTPELSEARPSALTDSLVILTSERNGIPIGKVSTSKWFYVCPKGIHDLLLYMKTKYNNPLLYITENGIDEIIDETLSLEEALADTSRVDYFHDHLYYLQIAIENGANVKGYFAWSLTDNFGWSLGSITRFGTIFVDYHNLKRYPKLSAIWFRDFLQGKIDTYDH